MSGADRLALRARYVFPIDQPPLADGVVVVRGDRIEAIGPASQIPADEDLGNVALLPGFANAHTHLDLSDALGKCPPSHDFVAWLRQVIAHRRSQTPKDVDRAIAAGIEQLLRSGTTMVGDISADGSSWTPLTNAPLRAVVYREVLGLTEERGRASLFAADQWRLARLNERSPACIPGFSPHAPYSVHRTVFHEFWEETFADDWQPPIAVHFMESAEEVELIEQRSGPFVQFLKDMGVWEPEGLIRSWSEVLKVGGPLIHGNFLPPGTAITQPLVYCPRTHASFGHPPHPFRTVRTPAIALGTDSLASNPDLNILEEARFIARFDPNYNSAALLRHLTLDGAKALGFDAVAGSLTPGKSADLVVLPLPDSEQVNKLVSTPKRSPHAQRQHLPEDHRQENPRETHS